MSVTLLTQSLDATYDFLTVLAALLSRGSVPLGWFAAAPVWWGQEMRDAIYVVAILIFFGVSIFYVRACERLK